MTDLRKIHFWEDEETIAEAVGWWNDTLPDPEELNRRLFVEERKGSFRIDPAFVLYDNPLGGSNA